MPSPAGTACSARTSRSSPAPTSTASRSSAPPRPTASPTRSRSTARRSASGRSGTSSTSATTTSSAPASPGTTEGWYCVSCEAYYTEADLLPDPDHPDGPGLCPIHVRPVEWLAEDNWFFRLSAFEQPLLDWYAAHPGAVAPEGKRNEALGIIRQGLDDVSISRSSIDWGVPVPWDQTQVFYVWYDALINYATAVGYGSDRA